MRSGLSKSESNAFRNILVMSKSHTLYKKFLKNVYINSLGTEISQNHLSILKWSLNKYWGWKVWSLSFQMPCRTHFFESWMQRSIILDENVSYLYLGVLSDNDGNAIFTLYWFLKWHCLLPKGQQKLTTFSDLIEEGLSYLQLFLELPETIWSL